MKDELVRTFAQLGEALLAWETKKDHLRKEEYLLKHKAKEAFLYFLERMFYRGRADSLSLRFFSGARPKVEHFLSRPDAWSKTLSKETDDLDLRKPPGELTNDADIEMVYGAIAAVSGMPENNVMKLAKDEIEGRSVKAAYDKITDIKYIKDKLTCMFLRDVAYLYDLCDNITNDDVKYFLPVDTWVLQWCRKLGVLSEEKAPRDKVKMRMVEECAISGVSPIYFDHGLWGMSQLQYVLGNFGFVEQNLQTLRKISDGVSALKRVNP